MLQEAKTIKSAAKNNMADLQAREYFLESVDRECMTGVILEKSFLFVTESELNKLTGHKRKAKDPTLREVEVMGPAGVSEVGFIFTDPESPWRRLRLQSSTHENRKVHLMPSSQHLWEEQGQRVSLKSSEARMKTSKVKELLDIY